MRPCRLPNVPQFMASLRERDAVAALALEFAILTAARSGEVLGARWAEIDFDNAIWTVPATRMKGGRVHRVPLSRRALVILKNSIRRELANLFSQGNGRASH